MTGAAVSVIAVATALLLAAAGITLTLKRRSDRSAR